MKGFGGIDTTQRATPWDKWGQHVAIAAAYAGCYELAHYLSFPQWALTAGLRLSCLLLLPIRYWPALALGEFVPLAEVALLSVDKFGIYWSIAEAVPMVVLWMIVMKPLRQHWSVLDSEGRIRMPLIFLAALGTAIITAIASVLSIIPAILHSSTGTWPDPNTGWPGYLLAHTLGSYLGSLTLAPAILALRERFLRIEDETLRFSHVWHSLLLRDVLWWMLPSLAAITAMAAMSNDDLMRQVARLALIGPVLTMTWRHGWHGTAIGGMAASVALAISAAIANPSLRADPATIQIEAILALMLTGALLVGARAPLKHPFVHRQSS
ncbi:MAG: hypothetical protein GAK28_01874 [Luteibacter sp.]|uniref:MASE1 domain-containing protein n=1 Tax=Luteibacter sp. TaxID=1886636 RepID=UPI00137F5AA8|nr:MASE1 domain-containing protein [Luteibacter sp.]KAF1007235.1 MAG: hypothetical protein GAK28_01874 [Luteibacter sp.]